MPDEPPQTGQHRAGRDPSAGAHSAILALRAAAWALVWYVATSALIAYVAPSWGWRPGAVVAALAVLHVVRPGGDRRG